MITAKRLHEKLAWGADMPLYGGYAKAGKLHKVALSAGVKLTKSYAPQRKMVLAPKLLYAPEKAVSFVGEAKILKSADRSLAQGGQKQSTNVMKLGDFGHALHRTVKTHLAHNAIHKRVMSTIVKYHMAPKQGRSFAPVIAKARSFAAGRRVVGAAAQGQRHRETMPAGAERQMSAGIWEKSRSIHQQMLDKYHMSAKGDVAMARAQSGSYEGATEQDGALSRKQDFEDMLDAYFLRQSRLPPAGGTGVNPKLSPLWAGLKIPM